MSIKYTDLTYNELIELAPKDKPFQLKDPYTTDLDWCYTDYACNLRQLSNDCLINTDWLDEYKRTFDLIVHHLDDTTLEQYQVGDEVEILDNNGVSGSVADRFKGKLFTIKSINEFTCYGTIAYRLEMPKSVYSNDFNFNHNCLRKVVSKKPTTQKTITIGGDTFEVTEELTNVLKNLKKLN